MKVSIITATYNSEKTIEKALRSVLNQTHDNIESIIVDGQSRDETEVIVKHLITQYPSRSIRWHSEQDDGIYDALNKGINMASGDVIGFVHSDDLLASPDILQNMVNIFETENCDGVYGDLKYVQFNDPERVVRFWKSQAFKSGLLKKGWMPPHPTVFLGRSVYERLGGFDTTFKIAADYDFLLRLFLTSSFSIHYIPKTITLMRLGGVSNRSLKSILNKSKEDYRALKKNKVGGLGALLLKNSSKLSQFWKRDEKF
ncbi:glycosyltransferase family 2 protein [Winogradskyella alexanderae]|uniref:Glycosyltransferase n=1 Tax=Winogradskyella alexanderae TaxID=2877123 RepID=A0ABS7XR12_9FLAO|nr:glycosyltransferase family 2 protein [Winogradskyella alexanderae]MCA0132438.1 glycosyltransferase [Winogradskyella alexanderae]